MLELLIVNDVGTRPLVFVAHGLGGVVVKELLRQATTSAPAYRPIWDHTVAVVFLATPVALPHFATNPFFRHFARLNIDNQELNEVDRFYRAQAPRKGITTLSFAAAGSVIFSQTSADPGVPDAVLIPIDAAETAVAKPTSRNSLVVASVQRLLENVQDLIQQDRLPLGPIRDESAS
jgi:hypothetical protein